jgi:glycosyltransferase involved in cell wall biosynthesis
MAALTLAHVDAETGFSGGEVQVFLLMEGLRALGHRCVLVAAPGSRAEETARERGFETRAVRMRGDLDLGSVAALKRTFAALRPDLVHLHTGRATWLGGLAARVAGVPAITTRRMDRRVRRSWRTKLVYGALVRRVAAISPAVAQCLKEGGVDPARIVLVPSAIDPRRIEVNRGRAATRASLGVDADPMAPAENDPNSVVLLALASLVPRKGLDVFVDALALLARDGRRPHAWIAGDGPERDNLLRRIAERGLGDMSTAERGLGDMNIAERGLGDVSTAERGLGDIDTAERGLAPRVKLLGRREDVGDLLAACDAFVLPARREGLGVSALEAMYARRAVVASRVGGLADAVVEGRTGLLVPPDDAEALARALTRIVDDAELRARLGANGPERVAEGFLPEQMVAAYVALYRDVLAECSLNSA